VGVQRWRDVAEVPDTGERSVVTIGVFDGVHRGHRALVRRTVGLAHDLGVRAVVVTFDPHPMRVVRPDAAPLALSTVDQRLDLFESLGVDATLVLSFTRDRSQQPADDFVREILVDRLHAARVVVGENFRFGHKAAGTIETLRTLGPVYGFEVESFGLVGEGPRWSSTAVRDALTTGDVEAAARILDRPHRVEGIVVRGDQRGRAFGYPTANLETTPHAAIPADGIYAGWLRTDEGPLPAAISIGTNPTFDGVGRRVEAYALGRDDLELYGDAVAVDFAARLRETVRFDSVDELLAQMARDCEAARVITAGGLGPHE
jgi:riboflavin kinase/FMN adenylyltransferase